jgi:drug/metabolite transporter (DMT)-like permease
MMRLQRRVIGRHSTLLLTTFLCVVWGLTFVVQKVGLRYAPPLWFATGRAALAAMVLLPGLFRLRHVGIRGHALAAVLGLTNVAGFLGFQLVGLDYVSAGTAATIIYTQPLLVIIGARVFLSEPVLPRRLIGALIGVAGVGVVGIGEAAGGSLAGVALLVVSASSWATGTLILKLATSRPLISMVGLQNLYGVVPLAAVAAAVEPVPSLTSQLVWTLLYAGIVASAVGWLVLALLLRRGEAGAVASSLFSVPLLGAFFGVVLLDEPLRPALFIGVLLVAAGIRLAASEQRRGS